MSELFSQDEVRKTLSLLIAPDCVFEIRALDAQLRGNRRTGTVSGYFDSADACVSELEKLTVAKGIYITLNPVNGALLARRANRLDYAEKNATTGDQHILGRRRMLLDVDAERPSGISSSKDEKKAAHKKAREIFSFLKQRGWPSPVVADSGNGYHVLYCIELPCDDEKLLEGVLAVLANRFDGDGVKLDRAVFNPARIARLYGTLAGKGDNTKERPHRLSKILSLPDTLDVVSVEQMRGLVEELQPEQPPAEKVSAEHGTFDVEAFFQKHAIAYKEKRTLSGEREMWLLEACPFNPDHNGTEVAVFRWPSGKLGFQCKHSSDTGKGWKDFRRLLEPDYDYGKAEFVPTPRIETQPRNGEPVELPPPPAPYVPPPLNLLPGVLQDYVHAAAKSLNVDVSYILLPKLSSLGTAIGNSRSILLKRGFVQPPVIWTGIIGRSGSRKSPALDAGCKGVMEKEHELIRQNKQVEEEDAEALEIWETADKKKRGVKPAARDPITCIMDKLTFEVLADKIEANRRGVLIKKDELVHWFESFDQYHAAKGSDVGQWLSLHTGVLFAFDRRSDKRSYRIWQPRVNISGGIQLKVFKRILTPDYFERGLPARFLFSHPPFRPDYWSEATISDAIQKAALDLFEELWFLQPEGSACDTHPRLLSLDKHAKALFVDFYNECGAASVEASEQEEAAWSKLTGYAARLALVGQLARDPHAETITEDTMAAACELTRWFGNEAVRIYAELAETPEQLARRDLVEFVVRRGGAVYERDVMQSFTRLKNNKAGTERELTALVNDGLGEWEPVPTTEKGGRPARKFHYLGASTSTQPAKLPSVAIGSVDVDSSNSQKNEDPSGLVVAQQSDGQITPAKLEL